MTNEEFLKFVIDHFEWRKSILCDPAKERTFGSKDRFASFKTMATMLGTRPPVVALFLMTKHLADLKRVVFEGKPEWMSISYLYELVADVQNYLDLLLALLVEEYGE